ncbi:MAG: glycosyltransferase family 10 [Bacteroidota bacterium]
MRQTPAESRKWGNITFTEEEIDECDVLVVLNRPYKSIIIKTRQHGKWLFSQESPIDLYRWHTNSFQYFDRVYSFWPKSHQYRSDHIHYIQTGLPWHINKSYDELINLPSQAEQKRDAISWVTSNASNKPGHKIRMSFKRYLEETRFNFDLFGRGFTPIDDKFDAIYPYKYSIAIENFSCNDYWTEKIADCFLSWTMPIYFGCSNIEDYFPKESMIRIDPNRPKEAVQTIRSAVNEKKWEANLEAIGEARSLILNEYQIFPMIAKKIQESTLPEAKSWAFIPANRLEQNNNFKGWLRHQKLRIIAFTKQLINA